MEDFEKFKSNPNGDAMSMYDIEQLKLEINGDREIPHSNDFGNKFNNKPFSVSRIQFTTLFLKVIKYNIHQI